MSDSSPMDWFFVNRHEILCPKVAPNFGLLGFDGQSCPVGVFRKMFIQSEERSTISQMRCRVLKSWKESIATWVPEENMDDVGIRSTISEEYYNISQMRGRVMKSSESTAIWAHERETRGDVVILSGNSEEYSISLISRVLESSKRVPTCEYVREDAD